MPKVLATELSSGELTVMEADIHSNGHISIEKLYNWAIPFSPHDPIINATDAAAAVTLTDNGKDGFESALDQPLSEPNDLLGIIKSQIPECDYSVGVINSPAIISNVISLPFDDKKKIEQVAPVQLQDVLPFDPDGFIAHHQVLGQNKDGEFDILITMIPESDLNQNITFYNQVGLNPKILTPKASALISLKTVFPEELSGSFILLAFGTNYCSVLTYLNDQLKVCRDLPFNASSSQSRANLSTLIRTITAKAIRDDKASYQTCYAIGAPFDSSALAEILGIETKSLFIENVLDCDFQDVRTIDNYAWAVGLFLYERQKKKPQQLINFRVGPYAFEPLLDRFITALKEEAPYFIVTALVVLIWVSGVIYFKASKLDAVNSAIKQKIAVGFPTEEIAAGQETIILNNKIDTIKQQLGSLGSLSSTATLNALKTLSTTIDPSVGIKIDTLTVSHSKTDAQSKLAIEGSVADIPKAGILQESLKKQSKVFCKVDFQSKGQISGSNRAAFSTTISLCD